MTSRGAAAMLGFDTGFFMQLLKGDELPVETWRNVMQNSVSAVCSCLTIFELERLSLKGIFEDHFTLCEGIYAVCEVVWLDTAMLSRGARLCRGLGIPAMDGLILAGLLLSGAQTIYTTDRHFTRYEAPGVRIVNLKGPTPTTRP